MRGRKLGEQLAERVEEEIIASGWPVGKVLGSEAELIERYGVSRAVFREAMRIVDHHGVAEMRRGPGGGLVVVAPKSDAAVRTLSLNLEYLDLTPEQINEARLAIELSCVRSAIANLDDDGRAAHPRLPRRRARHRSSRAATPGAPTTTSPPTTSICWSPTSPTIRRCGCSSTSSAVSRAVTANAPTSLEETAQDVHRAHTRIAEAMLARDVEAAERRMQRHLDSVVHYLHALTCTACVGALPRIGDAPEISILFLHDA